MYAPKTLVRRHLNRHRRLCFEPMVDDTKNRILTDEPNNAHRRLHQGYEAFRPAFSCNDKVTMLHKTAAS
jgi:hypothetical protein